MKATVAVKRKKTVARKLAKASKVINNIEDLYVQFGGPTKLAKTIGHTQTGVSMWRADKKIPQRWHYILDREARRQGLLINPKLFGEKQLFPYEQKMLQAA